MGQREKAVRTIHDMIVGSDVFGSGTTARVAMSYAPRVDNLPFCVFDITDVDFVGEDEDPAEQIVGIEITINVFATDGFSAARAADSLHDHLLSQEIVLASTSLSTTSDDYTALDERPRGLVNMQAQYRLDLR